MMLNPTKDNLNFINFFKGLITVSGLILVFAVPPFNSPDEPNHFWRIHQIAGGEMFGTVDTERMQMGQYLPASLDTLFQSFQGMIFEPSKKTSFKTITELFKIPLNKNTRIFFNYPNTARYAPLAYAPQSIVIATANAFNFNPLYGFYLARLAGFLFWLACIFTAVHIAPVLKNTLLCFAALPTSVAVAASLSADTVFNGLIFVAFAYFLRLKFSEIRNPTSEIRDLLIFCVLILITTWCKICYFPILFLLILVDKNRFGNSLKRKYGFIILNLLLNIALILVWNNAVHRLIYPKNNITETTYTNMRDEPGLYVNPDLQVQRILQDVPTFIKNFIPATFDTYGYTYKRYISSFGWESWGIAEGLLVAFSFLFLVYLIIYSEVKFTKTESLLLLAIAHAMTALFLLSQHLHWDTVGDKISTFYLGKYFVPVYPLIFWAISSFFTFKFKIPYFDKVIQLLYVVVFIDFFIILFQRYYYF